MASSKVISDNARVRTDPQVTDPVVLSSLQMSFASSQPPIPHQTAKHSGTPLVITSAFDNEPQLVSELRKVFYSCFLIFFKRYNSETPEWKIYRARYVIVHHPLHFIQHANYRLLK